MQIRNKHRWIKDIDGYNKQDKKSQEREQRICKSCMIILIKI